MATVIVCDDAPIARETVRRVVATVPGVTRVLGAASGEELLGRWGAERPALALIDVRMPGLGGVETTRRLLSLHPDACVLMVTTAEDVDGVARAVTFGARGYVVKDAGREEIALAIVQTLTDSYRRQSPMPSRPCAGSMTRPPAMRVSMAKVQAAVRPQFARWHRQPRAGRSFGSRRARRASR